MDLAKSKNSGMSDVEEEEEEEEVVAEYWTRSSRLTLGTFLSVLHFPIASGGNLQRLEFLAEVVLAAEGNTVRRSYSGSVQNHAVELLPKPSWTFTAYD